MRHVLTIAGSDSSGGAGIQGDLKTIAAHGHHGLSVITAVTAQNSLSVRNIFPVANVAEQLEALGMDIRIDAVKIGMVHTAQNVKDIVDFLRTYTIPNNIPVVLDPVMISSTGKALATEEALAAIINDLMPLCSLLTPNVQECCHITGMDIKDIVSAEVAAKELYRMTGTKVVLKGGHLDHSNGVSTDILYDGIEVHQFSDTFYQNPHSHGTGCCLSSALACRLSEGYKVYDSTLRAKDFVTMAIKHGYKLGKGEGPVDPLIHFMTNTVTSGDVANCCLAVGGRPIMAEAADEMAEITPQHQGLVINMGTLTTERLHAMTLALKYIDHHQQKVLLDPVGCGSSDFRLRGALDLLETGKVTILKANPREGMALLGSHQKGAYGVDSDALDVASKECLGANLYKTFAKGKSDFTVIITGAADVVVDSQGIQTVRGGSPLQQKLTGTGCMLNAVLMTATAKEADTHRAVIRALTAMNRASEQGARRLPNKKHLMTYRENLINGLTDMNRDVYLITDEGLDFETDLLPMTEAALKEGIGKLQYRVKGGSDQERFRQATILKDLCDRYCTSFIINDDVALAKAVGADGVHLGIHDKAINKAREELGDKCLVGATAKTVGQARAAQALGADYLGVGALNPSPTKTNAKRITGEALEAIRKAVSIPIYGIGGIRHSNLNQDLLDHLDGVAVVSAVYQGGMTELRKIKDKL